MATTALPSYVPPAYQSWVLQAAAGTGLPANVVAAQIEMESGFNPNATSSTGAQGIAQFEPGTFADYGTGSAYNPSNALTAYIGLMSALLKQFNGNVSQALAAYNAGPNNLAAGAGYARTILANAGVAGTATAGNTTTGQNASAGTGPQQGGGPAGAGANGTAGAGGGNSAVASIAAGVESALTAAIPGVPFGSWIGGLINSGVNVWTDLLSPVLAFVPLGILFFTNVLKMLEWIVNPTNWVRIGAAVLGFLLLGLGIHLVSHAAA